MSRIRAKGPYYTTFRRRVRRWAVAASLELPLSLIQQQVRADLHDAMHTVVESSWTDDPTPDFVNPNGRVVSVRYVTGGMRHGLGESIELQPQVSVVEFARAHNLPKPPPLEPGEEVDLD